MTLNQNVYQILNNGLGGCYEVIKYSKVISKLAKTNKCESILELNATYIAGVPGFNSCILSQEGFDVTVAVTPRDYEDTLHVWGLTGLKADIVRIESPFKTSFANNQFDFVYNHLAIDQYPNPMPLINEMRRISRNVVLTLSLSPFNYGYWIHRLSHKIYKEKWDHGYNNLSTIGSMKKIHNASGLCVIEYGACDAPPWMDTVNAQIGESMTYLDAFPKSVRNKWVWCSINPECQNHKLVNLFGSWEDSMPLWFKQFAAHHLYVASVK